MDMPVPHYVGGCTPGAVAHDHCGEISRGKSLTSQAAEACSFQGVASCLHQLRGGGPPVGGLEGGSVDEAAPQGAPLADQALQQHADCHARGEGVRVDDQIRPAHVTSSLFYLTNSGICEACLYRQGKNIKQSCLLSAQEASFGTQTGTSCLCRVVGRQIILGHKFSDSRQADDKLARKVSVNSMTSTIRRVMPVLLGSRVKKSEHLILMTSTESM